MRLYGCRIDWLGTTFVIAIHILSVVALFYIPTASWKTLVWCMFLSTVGASLGVCFGVHRMWSHKSFQAAWPVRLLSAISFSMTFQRSILNWCKQHRVHHRHSDQDADPYNASNGFWYSHMLWIFVERNDAYKAAAKEIDMSDLKADPIVMWQRKHATLLSIVFGIIVPTIIPMYFWNETFMHAYFLAFVLRTTYVLHCTWSVNSFAHMFGNKPYSKFINPAENPFVSFFATGEGFHNYHHSFPYDYSASEVPYTLNLTTCIIDFFDIFGLVYEKRRASPTMVMGHKESAAAAALLS